MRPDQRCAKRNAMHISIISSTLLVPWRQERKEMKNEKEIDETSRGFEADVLVEHRSRISATSAHARIASSSCVFTRELGNRPRSASVFLSPASAVRKRRTRAAIIAEQLSRKLDRSVPIRSLFASRRVIAARSFVPAESESGSRSRFETCCCY